MIKIRRKQFVTLLETLIALALTVAVLSTLTFFYRQVITLNNKDEATQKESFKKRYLENRLSSIIPQAVSSTTKKKNDFFYFTVSDPGGEFMTGSPMSLIFTFDNGVDLSKVFSGHVLGRIFLDTQKRLCLALWPSPNRWVEGVRIPMRLEVLLEGVQSLKFWFYVAPDKDWQLDKDEPAPSNPPSNQQNPPATPPGPVTVKKTVVKPSPENSWINEWSQDYKELPAIMKIELMRNGVTEYYAFPVSNSKRQPTYNQ